MVPEGYRPGLAVSQKVQHVVLRRICQACGNDVQSCFEAIVRCIVSVPNASQHEEVHTSNHIPLKELEGARRSSLSHDIMGREKVQTALERSIGPALYSVLDWTAPIRANNI